MQRQPAHYLIFLWLFHCRQKLSPPTFKNRYKFFGLEKLNEKFSVTFYLSHAAILSSSNGIEPRKLSPNGLPFAPFPQVTSVPSWRSFLIIRRLTVLSPCTTYKHSASCELGLLVKNVITSHRIRSAVF